MDHEHVVVLLAADRRVLVLAEPREVERLPVDEELAAAHLHCADPDGQYVPVTAVRADLQFVQVAVAGRPRVDVLDGELALPPGAAGDLPAGGVAQLHGHVLGALDAIADDASGSAQIRHHCDVTDVLERRAIEPDAAVDPRVVEEVVVVDLLRTGGRLLDDARRDGLPGKAVVGGHGDAQWPALLDQRRDVRLERRVPALVLGHLHVLDPHRGAVGDGVESQHDAIAGPAAGDAHGRLVPHLADMVARFVAGDDVVEAGGDGHAPWFRQRALPPLLAPALTVRVEPEVPQAVE